MKTDNGTFKWCMKDFTFYVQDLLVSLLKIFAKLAAFPRLSYFLKKFSFDYSESIKLYKDLFIVDIVLGKYNYICLYINWLFKKQFHSWIEIMNKNLFKQLMFLL